MIATKLRVQGCTIGILMLALAGILGNSNTSVEDQENAKRSTAEGHFEARWLDLGHDEHGRKLSRDEQQRLENEAREHRPKRYQAERTSSKTRAFLDSWLDSRLSGNSILDTAVQIVFVGLAFLLWKFIFVGLLAALAGCVTWALGCGVLLLVYGLFSGFQYSDHVISVISIISAVFVGIPVFLWVLCTGIYAALTENMG